MYIAIDHCNPKCTKPLCNSYSEHKLDEAVAFYVGNQLAIIDDGLGNLAYALAEIRCPNTATCENVLEGQSMVNKNIMMQFDEFKSKLSKAQCSELKENANEIVRLMMIPHIQGTLRYASRTEAFAFPSESMQAEGALFAAVILPKVNDCNSDAAEVIYNNMKLLPTKNTKAVFREVKKALEEVYSCLGITCEEIGGVVDERAKDRYIEGAEPCGKVNALTSDGLTVGLGMSVVGLCAVITFLM